MAIQIRSNQIADSQVGAAKLDLSSGTFNFASATVQVATPSADAQAANKGYVDSVAQGLDVKDSCKVATTANITLSGTQTIDGIAVAADDRVLVKNQSTASENGLYLCKAGAWSRTDDLAAGADAAGAFVFIEQGSTQADAGFVCTSDKGAAVVGTNPLAFTQFSGAGSVEAGNGLSRSGSTLSVQLDGSTLAVSGSGVKVADGGISDAQLSNSAAIAVSKLAASSVTLGGVTVSLGGSDATPAFNLQDATGYATGSLVGTISNAQLAGSISEDKLLGSIPNGKLANSSISIGGVTFALGSSDATPALDLADATNYPTSSLVGQISNSQLSGSIANSKLANSSISIGGVTLALGGSDATPALDLADATNYPTSSLVGSISNAQLAGSISADKLAGSIPDSALLNISAANKVQGSAVQLKASGSGIANDSGLKINTDGTTVQVNGSGTLEVKDNGVTAAKVSFNTQIDFFNPDGSSQNFDLSNTIPAGFEGMLVFRNGVALKQVASSPADVDEFALNRTGGSGGVSRIELGAQPSSSDTLNAFYIA